MSDTMVPELHSSLTWSVYTVCELLLSSAGVTLQCETAGSRFVDVSFCHQDKEICTFAVNGKFIFCFNVYVL